LNKEDYAGRDNLEVMKEAVNYNKFLIDLVLSDSNQNEIVVDFGAGGGTFSMPAVNSGLNLICIEPDLILSDHLRSNGLHVVNDIDQVGDNSIDYIYSLNVLEHIEDDYLILEILFQKLKPGGKILIYVPAFNFLFTSMDKKVGHFRRYSRKSLANCFQSAGFEIKESSYVDSLGLFATLAYKIWDQGDGLINLHMLKLYDKYFFKFSQYMDCLMGKFFGKNV
jgi:SAM-dependent methyltransferase